jgi:N-sulfoglucosamine sulfohydrolase
VTYADVVPTLLALAGGKPADTGATFNGTSFAAVLRGESNPHRQFTYGLHNNVPEGPADPSRTVSDGRWRYIRNLKPDELYIQQYLMGLIFLMTYPLAIPVRRSHYSNPIFLRFR